MTTVWSRPKQIHLSLFARGQAPQEKTLWWTDHQSLQQLHPKSYRQHYIKPFPAWLKVACCRTLHNDSPALLPLSRQDANTGDIFLTHPSPSLGLAGAPQKKSGNFPLENKTGLLFLPLPSFTELRVTVSLLAWQHCTQNLQFLPYHINPFKIYVLGMIKFKENDQ